MRLHLVTGAAKRAGKILGYTWKPRSAEQLEKGAELLVKSYAEGWMKRLFVVRREDGAWCIAAELDGGYALKVDATFVAEDYFAHELGVPGLVIEDVA